MRLGWEHDFFLAGSCGAGGSCSRSRGRADGSAFAPTRQRADERSAAGPASDELRVALTFAGHGSPRRVGRNVNRFAVHFDTLQPQVKFCGRGKPAGSLHTAHHELGVRALGYHHSAVFGNVARNRDDDALASFELMD